MLYINVRFVLSLRYSWPSHFVSLFFFHFAFETGMTIQFTGAAMSEPLLDTAG